MIVVFMQTIDGHKNSARFSINANEQNLKIKNFDIIIFGCMETIYLLQLFNNFKMKILLLIYLLEWPSLQSPLKHYIILL